MNRLLKIDDYIEVHMSKKRLSFSALLSMYDVTAVMDMTLYTRFILEME